MVTDKIVPTAAMQRCLTKALGVCSGVSSQVEYLEEIAKACPEIDPSVTELRVMLDHLDKLCRVGLRGVSASTPDAE